LKVNVKQGDIIWLNLDPTIGHEQRGKRPVLIISNNQFNRVCNGLVKVLPITTSKNIFPTHIPLPDNLKIHGKVMLQHERSVDILSRGFNHADRVPEPFLNRILELVKATY
jgi:mRNA interferase MazF